MVVQHSGGLWALLWNLLCLKVFNYKIKSNKVNTTSSNSGTCLQRRHSILTVKKYIRRCSTSLIIREMKIKTQRDVISHPLGCLIKITTMTNDGEFVEKLEYDWLGHKIVQSFWKTVWQFIKRLNTKLPCDPAIPLLRYIPKRTENICPHRNLYKNAYSSIIHHSQKQRQPKYIPTDEWIYKMWYIYPWNVL